jgi:hypothetical protein
MTRIRIHMDLHWFGSLAPQTPVIRFCRSVVQNSGAVENCMAVAGFSVGEITALIFTGAISFSEGITLVKIRGEAMQVYKLLRFPKKILKQCLGDLPIGLRYPALGSESSRQ